MKKLLATLSILALTAGAVSAQEASGSGSGAAAVAGSASLSRAEAYSNGYTDNSETDVNPAAIAPNLAGLYASPHTCMGSSTASVGINGVFSMGAGSTWQDDECNKREAVKLAAQLGLKQAAAAVFYDIGVVKDVIGVAENADLRAQQEAAQLAGIKMSSRATAARTSSPVTGETVEAKSNRPFWCDNAGPGNARWNECVD